MEQATTPTQQPKPKQQPWTVVQAPKLMAGPRGVWVAILSRDGKEREISGTFEQVQAEMKKLTAKE